MKIGVSANVSAVLAIRTKNGVRVSPVPRNSVVYSRYTNSNGIEKNTIRE